MDHASLVETLQTPAPYGHPVDRVEVVQTHISSVFLTGDFAYKLKKPMNFGFLDFTTAELRRRYCEAEVELNRRLAPSVYLRVLPVTVEDGAVVLDGAGEAVDWLVQMRQMDRTHLGPAVLARGALDAAKIDSVVDLLVPFYVAARTGPGVDEHGSVAAVKFNTDENFAQTEGFVGSALSREQFSLTRAFTNRFYADHGPLFARRVAEGRIRESHGDLHLGNIVFEPGGTIIFDCIEFNERFRCGDVAVDLAFLAMDLDFQGRPELSRHLVASFVEHSGDRELPALLDFYATYRAWVRGKIACFTSADPGLDAAGQRQQLELAQRYFALACSYASR